MKMMFVIYNLNNAIRFSLTVDCICAKNQIQFLSESIIQLIRNQIQALGISHS